MREPSEGRAKVSLPLPGPPPPLPRPPAPPDELPTEVGAALDRGAREPAARPGLRVAGFVVERPLGAGAMGQVYLARQTSLDRPVALKLLPADLATDGEFVLRFLREAKAAALLNHPNIIAVIDQGHDRATGCHYIAFELVEGGSVEQLLARRGGKLPEAEVLGLGHAMLQALAYAEGRGLVHRDVKPENILLDRAGAPKLADLGLAKRALDEGVSLTKTGFVLGTPLYMAPEQALGEKDLDVRADLYSLGLVLWRCLTGLTPFDEDRSSTSLAILSRHVNQDLPDVRDRAPEVSEGLARVIAWLAAREREARYRTAAQALHDVERLLAGAPPEGPRAPADAPGATAGVAARRSSSRRTAPAPAPGGAATAPRGPPLLVAVLVGVAALGLGIGLAIGTLGRPEAPDPLAAAPTDAPTDPAGSVPVVPPRLAPPSTEPAPSEPAPTEPAPTPAPTPTEVTPPEVRPPTPTPTPTPKPTPPRPKPTPPRPKVLPDPVLAETLGTILDLLDADPKRAKELLEALPLAPAPHPQDQDAVRRLRGALQGALLPALVGPLTVTSRHQDLLVRSRQLVTLALTTPPPPAPDAVTSAALRAVLDGLGEWSRLLEQVALTEAAFRATAFPDKCAAIQQVRSSGPADEVEPLARLASAALVIDHWRDVPLKLRPEPEKARRDLANLGNLAEGRLLAPTAVELDLLLVSLAAGRSEAQAVAAAAVTRRHDLGPVLDARVRSMPVSTTGVELAPARGLYLAATVGVTPRFTIKVRDVEVKLDGPTLADGRTGVAMGKKLVWPRAPGLLLEARERLLVLTPIDAATGAIGAVVELDLPGRMAKTATSAFHLTTDTALTRLDLVLPGVADLGQAEHRELRALAQKSAEGARLERLRFRLRRLAGADTEGR